MTNQIDAQQVLNDSFPVIQEFVNAGLLLPADSVDVEAVETVFSRGDRIDRFTIVRCVQLLRDTEVYQAQDASGHLAALQVSRLGSQSFAGWMLDNEARLLDYLEGQDVPRLLGSGKKNGRSYIAIDWCDGIPADAAAAEFRVSDEEENRQRLLSLCVDILNAYARLHNRGILHGDIHPQNILIDTDGTVRLIDFGLAGMINAGNANADFPMRGGVAFFHSPEYAHAMQESSQPPPVTVPSEIYALGAHVYYLLTGMHYLDSSLEQDKMLDQILAAEPMSFRAHGIDPWPDVERVLRTALEKNPAERFRTVADFVNALTAVAPTQRAASGRSANTPITSADVGLLEEVFSQTGWDSAYLRSDQLAAPRGSVTYGASGIAFFLYRASMIREDPDLLALAHIWASNAASESQDESSFYNSAIDITPETVGRITPFHTATGVYAVQCLIAQARGDHVAQAGALQDFVRAAWAHPCNNLDVTLGQSGILVVGSLLAESLRDQQLLSDSGLLALGNDLMARIWEEIRNHPPIPDDESLPLLGIAHGWAGVLYATLRWCEATDQPTPNHIRGRLEELARCAEHIGRGARWPWSLDTTTPAYMSGWCNGTAGYVFLWTLAHHLFGEQQYLSIAERAAWHTWEDPAIAANLCCGLAGRGYALLNWYKQTGDSVWAERAAKPAQRAAQTIRTHPLDEFRGYELSLYKGEAGIALLQSDLAQPEYAAMPLFETEGWS